MSEDEKIPVLLVDDTKENLVLLEALLENLNLELVKALSGNDAVRLTLKREFALVLLDVHMPHMDGFETAELIRSNPRTSNLPIVFITAYSLDLQHQFRGYSAGAVDFLSKPIEPLVLQNKVKVFCEIYRQHRRIEQSEQILARQVEERTALLDETVGRLLFELKERNRDKEAIQQSHELLRKLSNQLPGMMYQFEMRPDGSFCVPYASEAIRNILGCTPEEVREDFGPIARVILPEDLPRIQAAIADSAANLAPFKCEYRVQLPGQPVRWIWTNSVPEAHADGRITWSGFNADITERKRAEEEREKLQAQLFQAQKLESIGILAGGIAHDFNNLLALILGNISQAQALEPEEAAERDLILEEAMDACRRASDLSNRLLTFSKGGSPRRAVLALRPVIEESVRMALSGSKVTPHFDFPEGLPPVLAHESQLVQLFRNLAYNAREAMPLGGKLEVISDLVPVPEGAIADLCAGTYHRITFRDEGAGIPDEIAGRIFDPYFSTKELGSQKGQGLGLPIGFSIARKHGGTLQLDSAPGWGAVFVVYLPAMPQ